VARAGDAEKTLALSQSAGTPARRACAARGPGREARPSAFFACFLARNRDFPFQAQECLFKSQIEVVREVIAAPLVRSALCPCAAKKILEDVAEDIAETGEIAEIGEAPVNAGMTELIVVGALFSVAQDGVSLGEFLEFFLGFLIALRAVRVVFHRKFSVGAPKLIMRGPAVDAQYFVIVSFTHYSLYAFYPAPVNSKTPCMRAFFEVGAQNLLGAVGAAPTFRVETDLHVYTQPSRRRKTG
jgi:hypothetical protein